MATSSSSTSPEKSSRIIEIDIFHAKLNPEKKGKYYVDISISEGQGLRTKLVDCLGGRYSTSWSQKFVFSVPRHFVFDEKSMVSFTIFKTRKYLPDFVVGKVTSQMKALFPIEEELKKDGNEEDSYRAEAKYNDEGCDDYYEQGVQEKGTFQLQTSVGLPILKGSSVKGRLDICITAWKRYYPDELNWDGRNTKVYQIFKGSDHVGSLCVEKAAEEKYVSCVGNVRWRNLAMEYEEFIMVPEAEKPRAKRSLICCTNVSSHNTKD